MKILLLEDDVHLGRLIQEELLQKGYHVQWAQTLASAQSLSQQEFSLAIIDLNLPDGKGFDIVTSLRCPVIIMSALNDPQNRLKGVEMGVLDFIPKPFLIQELLLKMERLLGSQLEANKVYQLGQVVLDLHRRQIISQGETHLLNKRDYRLLEILTQKAPQVVSRDEIINYVYGQDQNPSPRTIDNAVVGIRQRLGDVDGQYIRSVRGEGYQWTLKGE